jgi:hypothetical protein
LASDGSGEEVEEVVVNQHRFTAGIGVTLVLLLAAAGARAGDFMFIKSAQNDTAQVSKEDLRDIFTGKRGSWKNGQRVELGVAPSGSPELKWLAQELIGASAEILLARIKQEVFKGDMRKPAMVASAQDCFALVKRSPGGLCVVDGASAKSLPEGTAVLRYAR